MADFRKIDEETLENVSGGVRRVIRNPNAEGAHIRRGPGLKYGDITMLENGSIVYTTGETRKADGYVWYQIDGPMDGWVAGSLIGY